MKQSVFYEDNIFNQTDSFLCSLSVLCSSPVELTPIILHFFACWSFQLDQEDPEGGLIFHFSVACFSPYPTVGSPYTLVDELYELIFILTKI